MRFDIELAAGVTVEESSGRGPRFACFRPMPTVGIQNADCRANVWLLAGAAGLVATTR